MADEKKQTCIVRTITEEQANRFRTALENHSWDVTDAEYCFFKASREKTSVSAYQSGKVVIQGKGAAECVEFILEGEVTGVPELPETAPAQPFFPHAGIDESGKGDFFGPLAIGCVFVENEDTAKRLTELGVKDSKLIKSDKKILEIAGELCKAVHGKFAIVTVGPAAYNRMYASFGNLNRLLAWGHIRTLENLLEKAPECTTAIADQFANERVLSQALAKSGKNVRLLQMTKGERDIAVAAASILARAAFVRGMDKLKEAYGFDFPKGAGPAVPELASKVFVSGGKELLSNVAKMHFRTAYVACGETPPEKPDPSVFRHPSSDTDTKPLF